MTEESRSIAELVQAVIDAQRGFAKTERHIAVMFADLCDSTAYKITRGDVQGLLKTYRHNEIVSAAVEKQRGRIVKFIGDEVMATFEGGDAASRAVTAALEIQRTIDLVNESVTGDEKIASKIGINCGKALLINFPGHEEADPQGKVVDAAARIIGLCKGGQILCSEAVKFALSEKVKVSEPHSREAKGIDSLLNVYEVLQESHSSQVPKWLRHGDARGQEIENLLREANISERTGKLDAAFHKYETILNKDKLHFAANYRKAKLLFRHRKHFNASLSEVLRLARQAEASFPDSGAAIALTLVVRWQQLMAASDGHEEATIPPEILNEMIERARRALHLCQQDGDQYGEMVSLNLLASLMSKRPASSDTKQDVAEAKLICDIVESFIADLKAHFIPAFYETHACVLELSKDYEKALKLARESSEILPSSVTHRTIARLIDLQDKMQ
jgi:class 3 adenylate cyclase